MLQSFFTSRQIPLQYAYYKQIPYAVQKRPQLQEEDIKLETHLARGTRQNAGTNREKHQGC